MAVVWKQIQTLLGTHYLSCVAFGMCILTNFHVSGAVYICTEDAFPSRRLQELFCSFPPTFLAAQTSINFGDSIFIEHIGDVVSNLCYSNLQYLVL